MYKKEFDSLKAIPHYVTFWGDGFYLQEYEKKMLNKFKDANILKMSYDDFSFEEAKTHLSENSLFGDINVLIVKSEKIPPNIEKLFKYAKDSYFFFFYYGNNTIKFKNNVRFFPPKEKELIFFIDEKAKFYNIEITLEAKRFLVKSVEPAFLEKEIEKLSNYSDFITLNDVKELVFIYKDESFEDIIVSILKGEEFEQKLDNLLMKVDYKIILSAIIRYLRDLYKYYLYIKTTGSSSLKGLLGYQLPFDIERERINLAIKFKEKDFYYLFKFLLEKELQLRKNRDKKSIFLEVIAFLKIYKSF